MRKMIFYFLKSDDVMLLFLLLLLLLLLSLLLCLSHAKCLPSMIYRLPCDLILPVFGYRQINSLLCQYLSLFLLVTGKETVKETDRHLPKNRSCCLSLSLHLYFSVGLLNLVSVTFYQYSFFYFSIVTFLVVNIC